MAGKAAAPGTGILLVTANVGTLLADLNFYHDRREPQCYNVNR